MDIEVLRKTERDVILDFLLYNMETDLRQKLMETFPVQYNEMANRKIMVVKRATE